MFTELFCRSGTVVNTGDSEVNKAERSCCHEFTFNSHMLSEDTGLWRKKERVREIDGQQLPLLSCAVWILHRVKGLTEEKDI
jgi:hypothetical protein